MKSATAHEILLLSNADVGQNALRQPQATLPGLSQRQKAVAATIASLWSTAILSSLVLAFTSRTETVDLNATAKAPTTASADSKASRSIHRQRAQSGNNGFPI